MASWHRFLIDFNEFWEASWGGKSTQKREKSIEKRIEQIVKKGAFWRPQGGRDPRTRLGRAGILRPPNY